MERNTLSASTMMGDKIRNSSGEDLGDLKELMIDVDSGRVEYAVLDMGGFLGVSNKLFAVPWGALSLDEESHKFVLDIEKDRLENAPGFDHDNWPDFSDTEWGTTIHEHYGTRT